jgi:hypothetical protein
VPVLPVLKCSQVQSVNGLDTMLRHSDLCVFKGNVPDGADASRELHEIKIKNVRIFVDLLTRSSADADKRDDVSSLCKISLPCLYTLSTPSHLPKDRIPLGHPCLFTVNRRNVLLP